MSERNLFFATVFSRELDRWKNETGNNQEAFGELTGIHPNSISRYKKGAAFPTAPVLDIICKTLGVNESIFFPSTPVEKLLYDEEFRTDYFTKLVEEDLEIVKSAGIHPGFWSFFSSINLIRDIFPFEIPPSDEYKGSIVFGNTNSAGKKTGFTENDLLYVKHLQNEVETIIMVMAIRESMLREHKRKEEQHEQERRTDSVHSEHDPRTDPQASESP